MGKDPEKKSEPAHSSLLAQSVLYYNQAEYSQGRDSLDIIEMRRLAAALMLLIHFICSLRMMTADMRRTRPY